MKYNPTKQHRRSIRLKGYDYHNAGAYFVTICTKNRECVLDDPIVKSIILDVWNALPQWFPTIELDEFVVMPNHIHFVVWIVGMPLAGILPADILDTTNDFANTDGGEPLPYRLPVPQKINNHPALGDVVGAFKSLVFTVYYDCIQSNHLTRRAKFWQTNYYEHIVRNDRELNAIRRYIIDNPINWKSDRDNFANVRKLPVPQKVDEYLADIEALLSVEVKENISA